VVSIATVATGRSVSQKPDSATFGITRSKVL